MTKALTAGAAFLVLSFSMAAYAADQTDNGSAMQNEMKGTMESDSPSDGMAAEKDSMGMMKDDSAGEKSGMESEGDMPAADKDEMGKDKM